MKMALDLLLKAKVDFSAANLAVGNFEKGLKSSGRLSGALEKSLGGLGEKLGPQLMKLGRAAGVFGLIAGAATGAVFVMRKFADVAEQNQQSMNKLEAVARNTGVSFRSVNKAAEELSSDGLLTFDEAASSLSNLLSSGMGLPQAIELLKVAKDNAVTNRQAHYQLGESVVTFTEGIRNENSQLTDSVGITKNYNAILEEETKKRGLKIDQLSKEQKAQFIANGFIKEGAAFIGQASQAADTYTGAKARAEAATKKFAVQIGNFMQPAMKDLFDLFNMGGEKSDKLVSGLGKSFAVLWGFIKVIALASGEILNVSFLPFRLIVDQTFHAVEVLKQLGGVVKKIMAGDLAGAVDEAKKIGVGIFQTFKNSFVGAVDDAKKMGLGIVSSFQGIGKAFEDVDQKSVIAEESRKKTIKQLVQVGIASEKELSKLTDEELAERVKKLNLNKAEREKIETEAAKTAKENSEKAAKEIESLDRDTTAERIKYLRDLATSSGVTSKQRVRLFEEAARMERELEEKLSEDLTALRTKAAKYGIEIASNMTLEETKIVSQKVRVHEQAESLVEALKRSSTLETIRLLENEVKRTKLTAEQKLAIEKQLAKEKQKLAQEALEAVSGILNAGKELAGNFSADVQAAFELIADAGSLVASIVAEDIAGAIKAGIALISKVINIVTGHKETLQRIENESEERRSQALIQKIDQDIEILRRRENAEIQSINRRRDAELKAFDEGLLGRNQYSERLKALDELDRQDRLKNLKEELADAQASGDEARVQDLARQVEREELRKQEADRAEEIAKQRTEIEKKYKDEELAVQKSIATQIFELEKRKFEAEKKQALAKAKLDRQKAISDINNQIWLFNEEGKKKALSDVNSSFDEIMASIESMVPPEVPAFEKGGIVRGPQFALVGERPPEAILPASLTRLLLEASVSRMNPGTGQVTNHNQNDNSKVFNVSVKADNPFELVNQLRRLGGADIFR